MTSIAAVHSYRVQAANDYRGEARIQPENRDAMLLSRLKGKSWSCAS